MIEIRAPEANYDYHNKYFSDDTQYLCPAPIERQLSETIQRTLPCAPTTRSARAAGAGST